MSATAWIRFPAAMLLGCIVTAAVFLLMQRLIEPATFQPDEPPPGAVLTFLPVIEPVPPPVRHRQPNKPPDPQPPPPTRVTPPIDPGADATGVPILPPEVDGPGGPVAHPLGEGDALPVVKVQPVYPRSAIARNLEGYVLLEFTIDPLGRVVDVQVVEAQPPGVFERAAQQAAERFRYKPRVVNGEAVPVTGVRHLLTFELKSG